MNTCGRVLKWSVLCLLLSCCRAPSPSVYGQHLRHESAWRTLQCQGFAQLNVYFAGMNMWLQHEGRDVLLRYRSSYRPVVYENPQLRFYVQENRALLVHTEGERLIQACQL